MFELYHFTGKVVGASKNVTTEVHRTVGYQNQVRVHSSTTTNNDLFLIDDAGQEKSFQLTDFNVSCREGQILTVTWAIRKGKQQGPYFAVENKTTDQFFFKESVLFMMFRPRFYLIYVLLWGFIFGVIGQIVYWSPPTGNKIVLHRNFFETFGGFLMGAFVGMLLAVPIWRVKGNNRSKKFQALFMKKAKS